MMWALDHPWTVIGLTLLGLVVVYEALGVFTARPTLSQIATRMGRRHPWLPWFWLGLVAGLTAVLFDHFWLDGGLL